HRLSDAVGSPAAAPPGLGDVCGARGSDRLRRAVGRRLTGANAPVRHGRGEHVNGLHVLERVARHAALGVRFWDAAEATSSIDGLDVVVFSRANPRSRTQAQMN